LGYSAALSFGAAGSAWVNRPIDMIQNGPWVIGVPLQQHKRLQLHLLLECSALQISLQPAISLYQQVRDAWTQ